MNCKLVFLVIAALALAQAHKKADKKDAKPGIGVHVHIDPAKNIGKLASAGGKIVDGLGHVAKGAGSLLAHTAVGLGTAVVGLGQGVAVGSGVVGNIVGHALFGSGINSPPPRPVKPKKKAPKTVPLTTIDWNEVGFSYFNGRIFPTGSAQIRKVKDTRGTIAALLRIETVGLAGNAKLNITLRNADGCDDGRNFSMPLCALSSLNKKALMLTLGLKYIALPPKCPVPSGVFNLSYYYKIGGIDFFKGIEAGNYKIEFVIAEGDNALLKFFWRVIIIECKDDKAAGDKPAGDKPAGDKPAGSQPGKDQSTTDKPTKSDTRAVKKPSTKKDDKKHTKEAPNVKKASKKHGAPAAPGILPVDVKIKAKIGA